MTEENARDKLFESFKIDSTALEAADDLSALVKIMYEGIHDRTLVKDKNLKSLSMYSWLNKNHLKAIQYIWEITYGKPEFVVKNAINITCGIPPTREVIEAFMNDIKVNPTKWMEIEVLRPLVQYYLEEGNKDV